MLWHLLFGKPKREDFVSLRLCHALGVEMLALLANDALCCDKL